MDRASLLLLLTAFILLGVHAQTPNYSSFQCTANDVRITGPGQVTNEPCDCPVNTTFNASVNFVVENNANSDRTCITLNLCTAADGGCTCQNVTLNGTIPGKATQNMTAIITNYPCGAGLVCFGSDADSGKGRCSDCCATVTWRVPGQDPDCNVSVKQISSKCRHQKVCIQSRAGPPTLTCGADNATSCSICGSGTTTLTLCSNTAFDNSTFTLLLNGTAINSTTSSVFDNTTLLRCVTWTVNGSGSYTGSVSEPLTPVCPALFSNEVNISINARPGTPAVELTSFCNGTITLSATSTGASSYRWNGTTCSEGQTSATCTFVPSSPVYDDVCHSTGICVVGVTGSFTPPCESLPTCVAINQCIHSSLCVVV